MNTETTAWGIIYQLGEEVEDEEVSWGTTWEREEQLLRREVGREEKHAGRNLVWLGDFPNGVEKEKGKSSHIFVINLL